MRMPNYSVVKEDDEKKELTIRDNGPWDQYQSVTNGAEEVVHDLVRTGRLKAGWRLFYYDSEGESEGELDELIVMDGEFVAFGPGPGRAR